MLKSITLKFTENPPLELPTDGVTIFVGPNNSGKSLALQEIERIAQLNNRQPPQTALVAKVMGDWPADTEVPEWLAKMGARQVAPGAFELTKTGPSGDLENDRVDPFYLSNAAQSAASDPNSWYRAASVFLKWGLLRLDGRNRLALAQRRPSGSLSHPPNVLVSLFANDAVRARLQKLVYAALGRHLTIDPTHFQTFGLKLANDPPTNERSVDHEAQIYFASARPVEEESDGIQAFIGTLVAVLAAPFHTILIDEPEAFLHPPLARILGSYLAALAGDEQKSLLASTHSADFLMGCVQANERVRIVRLSFQDNRSSGRLVDPEMLRDLLRRPLMRSSNVASALFHEGAVVCESDNDRVFYSEIYHRLAASDGGYPSILFLNAHNKQTVPEIVGPLRRFGIPAVGIVDVDVVKTGGAEWRKFIEAMNVPDGSRKTLETARHGLAELFKATGKDKIQRDGGVELLDPQGKRAADRLFDELELDGLFVVRKGELETWLPDLKVGRDKRHWAVEVLDKMGSDPRHPDYMKPSDGDVWDFIRKIVDWISNEDRRGMP